MIANRDIAEWVGSVPAGARDGREELWELVRLLDRVLGALEAEAILHFESVTLDDWAGAGSKGPIDVRRIGEDSLELTIRRLFDERDFDPDATAELLTIAGNTEILEPTGGGVTVVGAVSVQGMVTGMNTIWIRTASDAWLPADLRGVPQPELYGLNAPRLRRALVRADEILLRTLAPTPSKLVLVNGFEMSNLPIALAKRILES